ncbi:hypothetical protein D3C77_374470 [compost metagenome]
MRPSRWMGTSGVRVRLASLMKPPCQGPSFTPLGPRRDTSPAGKMMRAPSCARCSPMARMARLSVLPPRLSTGSSRGRRGRISASNRLATILTSGRMRPSRRSRASPSRDPMGWFATIMTRPLAGMFSSSASLTQ